MSDATRQDDYLDPYREAADALGPGFRATLWNSAEAQHLRFEVMMDMVDFADRVIVDAGCGPGDLAVALIGAEVPFRRYIGIDGVPSQVKTAAAKSLRACTFVEGDFVRNEALIADHAPDLVVFSGSLNTMTEATACEAIRAAFSHASEGVVFNFLSDRAPDRFLARSLTPANRFKTIGMIDFALSLTPRVRFRQDYLDGHDATILIEHESA